MNVVEFMQTVYLGDRGLKGISLDCWEMIVKLQVDEISRIRSNDGRWNYYNDENVVNGKLVFTDVSYFEYTPPGMLPGDYIEEGEILDLNDGTYQLSFFVDRVLSKFERENVKITIICKQMHLETADGEIITK